MKKKAKRNVFKSINSFFKRIKVPFMAGLLILSIIFFGLSMYYNSRAGESSVNASQDIFHYQVSSEEAKNTFAQENNTYQYILYYKKTCPACHDAAPKIEAQIEEKNRALAEIEVSDEREIREKESIEQVPTLIKMKNGKEISRVVGSNADFKTFIE